MTADSHPKRSKVFWRRVALAPLCLVLVAGLHLVRVTAYGQSAWKGGGFGMFSTVDAPQARFLRAYAITKTGRRPIEMPARLTKLTSELRTAPSQARLDELARELARQSWVDETARAGSIAEAIDAWPRWAAVSAAALRTHRHTGERDDEGDAGAPSAQAKALVAAGSIDKRRQRGDIAPVEAIEIELWRYEYDGGTHTLSATCLGRSQADQTPHASLSKTITPPAPPKL